MSVDNGYQQCPTKSTAPEHYLADLPRPVQTNASPHPSPLDPMLASHRRYRVHDHKIIKALNVSAMTYRRFRRWEFASGGDARIDRYPLVPPVGHPAGRHRRYQVVGVGEADARCRSFRRISSSAPVANFVASTVPIAPFSSSTSANIASSQSTGAL